MPNKGYISDRNRKKNKKTNINNIYTSKHIRNKENILIESKEKIENKNN